MTYDSKKSLDHSGLDLQELIALRTVSFYSKELSFVGNKTMSIS